MNSIFKKILLLSAFVITSSLLVSCNSSGTGNTVEETLDVSPQQQALSNLPVADEIQDPRAFCPKTIIRDGTETFNVYEKDVKAKDEGAEQRIRFRASISETVRECNSAGDFLNIKVGIKGRYLSGPKGDTGAFTMPLRVAVIQGDEVLYSQLHQIPAEILPDRANVAFAYVDRNISIPKPQNPNVQIFVGFDEGPNDKP